MRERATGRATASATQSTPKVSKFKQQALRTIKAPFIGAAIVGGAFGVLFTSILAFAGPFDVAVASGLMVGSFFSAAGAFFGLLGANQPGAQTNVREGVRLDRRRGSGLLSVGAGVAAAGAVMVPQYLFRHTGLDLSDPATFASMAAGIAAVPTALMAGLGTALGVSDLLKPVREEQLTSPTSPATAD